MNLSAIRHMHRLASATELSAPSISNALHTCVVRKVVPSKWALFAARHAKSAREVVAFAQALDKQQLWKEADQVDRMIRTAEEWWFKPGEEPVYADGDVGDTNHEMLAQEEMLYRMGWDSDDFGHATDGVMTREYAQHLFDKWMPHDYEQHLAKQYENDPEALEQARYERDLFEYLLWKRLQENPRQDPQQARDEMMSMWAQLRNATKYALENYGWQRVHDQKVQLHRLNQESLDQAADGLRSVFDEDEINGMRFYIESSIPQKLIGPVTIDEIEDGSVLKQAHGAMDLMTDVNNKKRPPNPNDFYQREGD